MHPGQARTPAGVESSRHGPQRRQRAVLVQDPFRQRLESLVGEKDWPGRTYSKAGDEFGALTPSEPGGKLPALGERLEFIVPHCDPSVNLYDRLHACRGETVEEIWPVTARREVPGKPT
jgi:D-serine deaminase-like pyridoxal phosphate-dependent protein